MSKMKPAGMAIKGPWNRHGAPIDEVNENPWCWRSLSKSNKMREKSEVRDRSPEGAIGKKTTKGGQTKALPKKNIVKPQLH